jgi:PKD repeat protein
MANKLITEETEVSFSEYSQLTYKDEGNENVTLYVDNKPVGDIKVWKDSEMEGREYICVNYEIIYLDTIRVIEK